MTRRSKIWRVIAILFTVINVGGAGYALASGEVLHAAVHVALLPVGWVIWRLTSRTRPDPAHTLFPEERLERLQQSLDAIAIEVERIGEAQRYAEKVVMERMSGGAVDRDRA